MAVSLLVCSNSVLGYIIPPEDDPSGFFIQANSGQKLYGGGVLGDYTKTHKLDGEYYGVHSQWHEVYFQYAKVKLTFPYSSSWRAEFLLFYIDVEDIYYRFIIKIYTTHVHIYYTNGGSEDKTYTVTSNGANIVTLSTNYEVAYIFIEYEPGFDSGWMYLDLVEVYYTYQ